MLSRRNINTYIVKGSLVFIGVVGFFYLPVIFPFNMCYACQPNFFTQPREPPPRIYLPKARKALEERKFSSPAIDLAIREVTERMLDEDLANMFENCFPNTLDTTISWYNNNPKHPRTFVVTGDIPAMWIRDSTNQLLPYLPFVSKDPALQSLILGAVNLQASQLLEDPYANAFLPPVDATMPDDNLPRVTLDEVYPEYDPRRIWESKYELDSLAAFLKLSHGYWKATGDRSLAKNDVWLKAVKVVIDVIEEQMSGTWEGRKGEETYRFLRWTRRPSETLANDGIGGVVKRCGLVKSQFRPSDDATIFPYLIPANAMTSVVLMDLSTMLTVLSSNSSDRSSLLNLSTKVRLLSQTIRRAIYAHGVITHPKYGRVFAYEVDCYGSYLIMDDANIPSLLALPYLGFVSRSDSVYLNTRRLVLSNDNPWFFSGALGEGIGGPHVGRDMVWPMGMLVRVITSDDDEEIVDVLEIIKRTTNGTGFMHESFHIDDPRRFTRPWFAWANTLLGETVLRLIHRRPELMLKKGHWDWKPPSVMETEPASCARGGE